MRVLIINDILGRQDRLQQVLAHARAEGAEAIFVTGSLAPGPGLEAARRHELYLALLRQLGAAWAPVYLVPGAFDQPLADLTLAIRRYHDPLAIHLVHGAAAALGQGDAIAGFGGVVTPMALEEPLLQVPDWELRMGLANIAASDTLFQLARRRVLIFSTPPRAQLVDGGQCGSECVRQLILSYRPHLACCGGPSSSRGVERIDGVPVVNPGSLAEGAYVLLDLERRSVRFAHLLEPRESRGELLLSALLARTLVPS